MILFERERTTKDKTILLLYSRVYNSSLNIWKTKLMFVNISAKPVDIVLVQVYMPTRNHDDDEIEKLYEEISEILHQDGRGQMNAIVMGDLNIIVGVRCTV